MYGPESGVARVDLAYRSVTEVGTDEPRLDDDHVDAEPLDLEPHRVGQRLDRVLGRVVDAAAREREAPAHRRDVHDLAPALLAHLRQHQTAHRQQAEHVGVELGANALVGDRLDRARLAVAGVVDEHADRTLGRLDRLHRGPPRPLVDDVERERPAALGLQLGERLRPPRGCVDRPTRVRQVCRGRGTDPGGAPRHQHRARRLAHRISTALPTGTRG